MDNDNYIDDDSMFVGDNMKDPDLSDLVYKYFFEVYGQYDDNLFINLFSEVDPGRINDLFIYLVERRLFKKNEIDLMIKLGVDLMNINYSDLLNRCSISNLLHLTDHKQMADWKFADKKINQIRINEFLESNNDVLLKILLDSGLSFEKILVGSGLVSYELSECQINKFSHLSIDKINFITKKTLLYGHDVNILILSKMLYLLMRNQNVNLTLEDIRQFLQLGVDPHYDNDIYFILSCLKPSHDIILFFVNEYGCNINAHNSKALYYAINHCPSNVRLLLELGITINYEIIEGCFNVGNLNQAIDDLVIYGANITLIAKNNLGMLPGNDGKINYWKKLISLGVDFNKIISEHPTN